MAQRSCYSPPSVNYNNSAGHHPITATYAELLEGRRIPTGRGRTVSVSNQKGGVGKTTTSVNLASGLALRGHRILLVDVDPQSNATTGLGVDHRRVGRSTYDVLLGEVAMRDVIRTSAIQGLKLAPASLDLAGAEIELVGAIARERKLAEALDGVAADYDVVFVDCPPSLGLLTINALAAAQDLIVPVQCEYYALEGLGQLLETADRVRRSINRDLRIGGLLLTMYDARTKLAEQVADEVRGHFADLTFKTVIPRSVRLSEAPSFGEPVLTLDPSARGSIAYRLLAAEVEDRFGLDRSAHGNGRGDPRASARAAVPGPGGRGYGTETAQPPDLEAAWPRSAPWTAGRDDIATSDESLGKEKT
jgi:chromosome partitioning protein